MSFFVKASRFATFSGPQKKIIAKKQTDVLDHCSKFTIVTKVVCDWNINSVSLYDSHC